METVLKMLNDWSVASGLSMNTSKTELINFSRKYKIPHFNFSKLNGMELALTDSAKYLDTIFGGSYPANQTYTLEPPKQ